MSNVKIRSNELDNSDYYISDDNRDTGVNQIYNFKLENPTKFIIDNPNLNFSKKDNEAKRTKMDLKTKLVKIDLINKNLEDNIDRSNSYPHIKGKIMLCQGNNSKLKENKLYIKDSNISLYLNKNKSKNNKNNYMNNKNNYMNNNKNNFMNNKQYFNISSKVKPISFQDSKEKQISLKNQAIFLAKKNKSMEDFFENNKKSTDNKNNFIDNMKKNKYDKEKALFTFHPQLSLNTINIMKELNRSCDNKQSNCYIKKVKNHFFMDIENRFDQNKDKQRNIYLSQKKITYKSFSRKNSSKFENSSNKSLLNLDIQDCLKFKLKPSFLVNQKQSKDNTNINISKYYNIYNISKKQRKSIDARSLSSSIFYETQSSQAETGTVYNFNNENMENRRNGRNFQSKTIKYDKSLSYIETRFDEQMNNLNLNLNVKKVISFDEYVNILSKMGISDSSSSSSKYKDSEDLFLELKLFEILGGKETKVITTQNLINALKIILRIRKVDHYKNIKNHKKEDVYIPLNDSSLIARKENDKDKDKEKDSEKDREKLNFGKRFLNKEGELIISDNVILFLQSTFYSFYLKKLIKKHDKDYLNLNLIREKNIQISANKNKNERGNSSIDKIQRNNSEKRIKKTHFQNFQNFNIINNNNYIYNINNINNLNTRKYLIQEEILHKKTQNEFDEMKNCTFHPKIFKFANKRLSLRPSIFSDQQKMECIKHKIIHEKNNLLKNKLKECSFNSFLCTYKNCKNSKNCNLKNCKNSIKYLQSDMPKKSLEIISRLKTAREKFEKRLVNLNLRNEYKLNVKCKHKTLTSNKEKNKRIQNIQNTQNMFREPKPAENNNSRKGQANLYTIKEKNSFNSSSNFQIIQNESKVSNNDEDNNKDITISENQNQNKNNPIDNNSNDIESEYDKQVNKNSKTKINFDEQIQPTSSPSKGNNSDFNFCESEEEKEEIPLMFLDINLGKGIMNRIVVYDGDTPEELSTEFCKVHSKNKIDLDSSSQKKLDGLIRDQIRKLLDKIEEEGQSEEEKSEIY